MTAGATTVAMVLLLGGPLLSWAAADEVSQFQDPEIIESSGLIARDGTFITTNDSGDSGRLFVVDQRSGETTREISWTDEPSDVEALAPADGSSVWVGDIGDNDTERDEVEVSWVDLAERAQTRSYEVRYPGGPADAEALLSHPATGQLFIATKSVFGGEFQALPELLLEHKTNNTVSLGRVAGLVTDGAFFPDGRHLILRNYSEAFVYAFPTLDLVGEFALPDQEQGEGLAAAGDDSVYLSSEGAEAPILLVQLPAEIQRAMKLPDTTPTPVIEEPPAETAAEAPNAPLSQDPGEGNPPWLWLVPATLLGIALATVMWSRHRLNS